jgi:3-hydroxybutyryl-CoA dehydrogenase
MKIQSVGIIGAGTMGNGIAQVCAVAGLNVVMVDINDAAVERGLAQISKSLDRLVKKEILTSASKDAALKLIKGSTSYADLKDLQLVIEAATENQAVKEKILKQVDEIVSTQTIIATNTSSLSITKLAALDSNPARFIGMHFFNPPPLMALVEVIRGLQTSDETHAAIIEMAHH